MHGHKYPANISVHVSQIVFISSSATLGRKKDVEMWGRARSINHRLDPFSSGLRPGHRLCPSFVLFSCPFCSLLLFPTHARVLVWFSAISNRLISLFPQSCNSVVVQPGYHIISNRIVSTLLVPFTLTTSNASMNPWPREIYDAAIWGSWQIWAACGNKGSDIERNEIKTILFQIDCLFGLQNENTRSCYPLLTLLGREVFFSI